ncbi:pyridoxal phosphate-dependent aminotransferase [Bacilli bacterium]|uniref:pyridoxal phosphate-dependent aminotransferase n=1 Tax=Oceanobacillus caeni TaxID=405946 RepID=UPI00062262DA|nr:aspartate aminotransferase [Bacilli bacterium VT-13-104]PZD88344.1 pyridoxal phosphate-dependent aminotransferase [Bacilli bacterium]PZD90439.1 pyridoxal phosphate-dependent aminotransferase [Bacilli bacterium]PZD92225.1 pyridoxal phosphate-dependent aminotransferase [Bacilli bacterium]RCO07098.1 pyridoxal phosphate-dependent aminotransferase [Bacilli bacterium]
MELSKRVETLTPSSTLAITAKAKELKKQGYDVIGLGAGEPDFNTPDYILEAAKEAMDSGMTKYTPAGGIMELKEAIVRKFKQDNQLSYSTNEIIVTSGAKHALYTLFQVLLNDGDEVIIPAPFWVSYPEQVKLAGGTPVFVSALEENEFKLTPGELKKAVTDRTKAVVINSPSNPTGMMYSKEELEALGKVCLDHNILIISDEIYEKLIYTSDEHVSIASISSELKENTVVINGVSKSHSMTGWRIGYAAGPEEIIKAMTNLASHSTSNPTSIAQFAALAAYQADESAINEMKKAFAERLDTIYRLITEIPGITCKKPKGAFYVFPNVKEAVKMNGFSNTDEWVKAILEEEKVALVPGSGFGFDDNVRLSYALAMDELVEAAKRIKRFVLNHQNK